MDVEQRARELLAALVKIRDSTFRDAAALRGIADMAINSDRAGDFNAAALTPPEGGALSESDKDVALAQAVEFAEYVERQAKGAMVDAAKRFLSLPYAQELAKRLATCPEVKP